MDIQDLRVQIDAIDRQIVRLLNDRYKVVKEVGEWKRERGQPLYVPEREKALLEKLESINEGPMPDSTLRAVYREIMSGALRLESPLKVAFFGPEATFTHQAAKMKFGHAIDYISKLSIGDVFLLARCGKSDIRVVYSHAQSLGQCRRWLSENLPNAEQVAVASNARAAELAAREDGAAAIGSELAAEVYQLKLLEQGIQDNPNNTTRFLIIGRQDVKPSGEDKTSICFAIKDRIGALYDCLLPFKTAGITLSMIESRPSKRRNWEYFFFVDMLGHAGDPKIAKALEELNVLAHSLKILGSYPCALPLN